MRYTMEEDTVIVGCITPEKTLYRGIMDAISSLRESGFSRSYESVKRRALRLASSYYEKPRPKRKKPGRKGESGSIADLERRVAVLESMLALVPYFIYQLPAGHPDKFRNLPDDIAEIRLHDYEFVYKGELGRQEGRSYDSDIALLEELFYKFNMEHPKDFRGHSLSVSDVVKVGGEVLPL
jgi:hypothetical protein